MVFAPIYLALLWRALVDAMYYFLGTCAAVGLPQQPLPPLLAVVLRRLPERTVRKIASQEPPSSSGHNDAPPACLTSVSTGRDEAQGACLAASFRPLWTHTRRLCRRR